MQSIKVCYICIFITITQPRYYASSSLLFLVLVYQIIVWPFQLDLDWDRCFSNLTTEIQHQISKTRQMVWILHWVSLPNRYIIVYPDKSLFVWCCCSPQSQFYVKRRKHIRRRTPPHLYFTEIVIDNYCDAYKMEPLPVGYFFSLLLSLF